MFRRAINYISLAARYAASQRALAVATTQLIEARHKLTEFDERLADADKKTDEAFDMLHASYRKQCTLINILRDGRTNVFWFKRDNAMFTIETMGMLSDTPDEWRRQAGLTE